MRTVMRARRGVAGRRLALALTLAILVLGVPAGARAGASDIPDDPPTLLAPAPQPTAAGDPVADISAPVPGTAGQVVPSPIYYPAVVTAVAPQLISPATAPIIVNPVIVTPSLMPNPRTAVWPVPPGTWWSVGS